MGILRFFYTRDLEVFRSGIGDDPRADSSCL